MKKLMVIGTVSISSLMFAQAGNVGINTTTPGTTLDVNGAITNRETAIAISGNTATVPANVSQVQLTGAATATITITAPAAPNAGQRLVIFNNTTGGFGASLNGVTIPNGKALEYVYSNSGWRSTDGGSVGAAGVNIYNANGSLTNNRTVSQGANTLAFTGNQVNAFSVDGNTLSVDAANHRIGIGTSTPDTPLTVQTPDGKHGINHTNGTVSLKSFIGGGKAYFGTSTSNDLYLQTNNSVKATITSAGNFGIGTTTPDNSAVLDLRSGNKGFLLPRVGLQNLTDAVTITSPANGLMVYNTSTGITGGIGLYYNNGTPSSPNWFKMASVNDIPTFDTYVLSAMQGFSAANTSDQSYNYNQIVGTNCDVPTRCYVPSTTVFNPVYTITFDKKSVNADKYFLLSLDYAFEFKTNSDITPKSSHWVLYDIELILNGAVIRTFSSQFNIVTGASAAANLTKLFTTSLTGTPLLNTNNIMKVKIKPTRSLIATNGGTEGGQYTTGNSHLLDIKVKDVSFQLFEK